MAWPLWMVAVVAWVSASILFMARQTAPLDGDARVERLGMLLPPFAILSCLAFFFLAGSTRGATLHTIVMLIHHTAIVVLFLFLLAAEYLQSEAFLRIRGGAPTTLVAASYRRLWALTAVVPGAAAPVILLTGLHLIWEAPETNAPSHAWLLAIIVAFGLFFFDGLLGYTPIVRTWHREWDAALKNGTTVHRPVCFESIQLLAHCLSWPFVFLAGLTRFDAANPLSVRVSQLQSYFSFLPYGWPEVAVTLVLLLLTGLLVIAVRTVSPRRIRS